MTTPVVTTSRIALLITVVLGVAARAVVAARGWFYWDDLTLIAQARDTGVADLLLSPHDGHLMPGSWLLIWIFSALTSGFDWPAALAALVVGQLLVAVAVAYAAARISPNNAWWVTGLYLLTPLTLPVTTWLAAAVNSLPLHAAAAIWLAHGWLYLQRRRTVDLGIVAAAVAGACLFSERAILLAPVSLLLLCAWARTRGTAALAAAFVLPAAAWAGVYALVVGAPDRVSGGPGLVDLLVHGYARGFLPTLLGGPWTWERWEPGPPFANPSTLVVAAGIAAGLALVAWSAYRRRLLAMLVVLAYPALTILALAVGRTGPDTAAEITQTLRHFSEVAVLAALTLGVAAGRARRVLPVVALVALSCAVSTVTFAQSWAEQPARGYFTTLADELGHHAAPILDQEVALEVLLPVAHPYNRLSALLPEGQVTAASTEPTLVDASGHLIPAELAPSRSTSWEPGCAAPGSPLDEALDGPLFERDWVVHLNLLAAGPTEVTVSLGDGEPVTAEIPEGITRLYVQVSGGGESLRVAAGEQTVCLGQSEVGQLVVAD